MAAETFKFVIRLRLLMAVGSNLNIPGPQHHRRPMTQRKRVFLAPRRGFPAEEYFTSITIFRYSRVEGARDHFERLPTHRNNGN